MFQIIFALSFRKLIPFFCLSNHTKHYQIDKFWDLTKIRLCLTVIEISGIIHTKDDSENNLQNQTSCTRKT